MIVRVIYLLTFLYISLNYAQTKNVKRSNQRIETFNDEQGFYQNTINAIISDSKAYLWVATPNGLVKYDGYTFEYYYHDQDNNKSLPNNYISNLLTDSKGRLWIGTEGGLCIYLTDKEQFIPIKNSIKKEAFIKEDSRKRIWVGKDYKLDMYSANNDDLSKVNKIAGFNLEKELEGNSILDIEFISDSEFLIATHNKIYKINYNEKTNLSIKVSALQLESNIGSIKKIIKIDKSLWIGTNNGLYHMFNENSRLIEVGRYFDSNSGYFNQKCEILSLYLDKERKLWIGTKQNGVLKYDPKNTEFTSFQYDSKYKDGLSSNRINTFYEDAYGVLWIGTAQGGLNKFDKNQKLFQNYSHNPYNEKSLSSNLITDITEDSEGRIWFSFFESEICRTEEKLNIDKGNQIYYERLQKQLVKLKKQWVLKLYQDLKGYWWISTNEGFYIYDEKRDILKNVQLSIEGGLVDSFYPKVIDHVNKDQIIVGGDRIFILDNPWDNVFNDKPIKINKPLFHIGLNNQVNDYLKDSYGNYWFITRKGVFRVANNDGNWLIKNHITSSSGKDGLKLSNNRVFAIHISSNNTIWLGTFGGGLIKIELDALGEPKKIKNYNRKHGLRDEAIYGILEDDNGKLWISTDMGISCFNPINEEFNFYDTNDGILSNNFRQSAFLKTKKGIMLMGGVDGLTIFNPNQIIKNKITPEILISRLKINNQIIVPEKKINNQVVLNSSISNTKKIVLGYANRNISLDIIVQHSASPNKNRLAYKLEGVNNDWIKVDAGKTTATYTNLSSGTYNFLYKGTNGDGIWTVNTKSLTIQVLAPWYARWWSITLWIALITAIVFTVFKYLVRLEKLNQKLKFEQLDKERVREMNQAKLRFFTNISHDFKTPLSLIIGPLEKIEERFEEEGDKKYFSIIKSNISRLHRLIDQLISYRKAEAGHLELSYSKTTLGNFIYPLLEAFEDYAHRAGINFYYKVKSPNENIVLDIDKTERVLLNLISNAVKYSELNREVSIESGVIRKDKLESFFIEVSNSSKGIPDDKIEKIFDRFYRGDAENGSWKGTGIGLELCKTLTDLMSGSISVKSELDQKIVFKMELPFGENLDLEDNEFENQRNIVVDWLPVEIDNIQKQSLDESLPNILIVDDEKDVRLFLLEALKSKYQVTLAVDGEDALKKLKNNAPQLIISDVMMPKMNGYDFCKKVKSNTEYCHIPVILLTAIDDSTKKIKGFEFGADDYIVKPFSIKHLEVRVKKLIENKQRIFEYYSRNSFIPKDSLISSNQDKEFLERINVAIEKNMSDSSFGVEELAANINMSTSHFYRRLKELTGQAPSLYLRNFRLQKAAELLTKNKNLTAADVMFEIGIESKSYYSSAFKRTHGVSPSEFIKLL